MIKMIDKSRMGHERTTSKLYEARMLDLEAN